jgi:peptide-methionine (S)-S-oxide reductase
MRKNFEEATFGAGCFWGVEDSFMKLAGVKETTVGFMGGKLKNPTYEDVCTGLTGHAEVVNLKFDPKIVSYEKLLEIFWSIHDPTTKDRQGFDIGSQYRSIIFYYNKKQKEIAEKSKEKLDKSGKFKQKIVTEIVPASDFWKAEEYHQKYLAKHKFVSCHFLR